MTPRGPAGRSRLALATVTVMIAGLALAGPALASPGLTTLEDVSTLGTTPSNGPSQTPFTSADGTVTAFSSLADNLVPDDTVFGDAFVHDDKTGETTRISVATDGTQANNGAGAQAISGDGRYVVFGSLATNLVAGDTNPDGKVFVRDRVAGTTRLVSLGASGSSAGGSISDNGRFVAFSSYSSDLVPGDTNGLPDLFVRDLQSNTTTRVSLSDTGAQANGFPGAPSISADGRYVAFRYSGQDLTANDTNGLADIYVRDLTAGTLTLVSVSSSGAQANASTFDDAVISADGRHVAFSSRASNLVPDDTNGPFGADIFVRDLDTSKTVRVSVASNGSQLGRSINPSISRDGRLIAFQLGSNILVHDRDVSRSGTLDAAGNTSTTTESVASDNTTPLTGASAEPSLSDDGSRVAFSSSATDLVPGDTNGFVDIFAHTVATGVRALTVNKAGAGKGTVASTPAGIACVGASCSRDFTTGATVTLTPTPVAGSTFTGFTGACTGTGPCTVTLDQAKTVTATFAPSFALNVTKAGTGQGTVTSTPAAINCGSTCSADIASGTSVTLTAAAAAGSTFTGFSGACTGTGPCVVTLTQARSVTATFAAIPKFALTVTKSGTGQGTVNSTPSGVDCGSTCTASFEMGSRVTLSATAATGSTFTGFDGECTGTSPCVVTVDRAKSITATFVLQQVTDLPKTDPPGTVPPGVKPPVKNTPPTSSRVSVAGFTAQITPARDRRAPYRFTISGSVRRPTGVSASACKGGRVAVQTKVAAKTISTRRVTLKADCSYRLGVTFANKRRLGLGRLTLTVKFLGTARLKPATARKLSARAG